MQRQNLTEVAHSKDLLLKIEGHSVTMVMSDGEVIKSKKWSVGGHDWEVHWCPKNHWAGRHRPVTLDLVLVSEARGGDVKAKLSCRLVDPAGRLEPSEEQVLQARQLLRWARGDGEGGAGGVWLHRARFLHRAMPHHGGDVRGSRSPPRHAAVPSPDLHRHLGELLQKGTGADVTFHVSGEKFAAHKAVLASRSPVFMAELFGGMKEEASRRVEVKDMEPAAFEALLRFVYTDTAPELDQEGEHAASLAQHLLAGADRYGLDRLKLLCEGSLADRITVGTAATTLALAEQHGCSQLKASCLEFIAGYLDAVLESGDGGVQAPGSKLPLGAH